MQDSDWSGLLSVNPGLSVNAGQRLAAQQRSYLDREVTAGATVPLSVLLTVLLTEKDNLNMNMKK